jgi:serine/threonine protein kinase
VPRTSTLPRFFGIAILAGLTFFALGVIETPRIFRDSVFVRDDGWTARFSSGEWFVDSVRPDGPATGLLAPGDRITAVNGDARASRIGPKWQIQDVPYGTRYQLDVNRDGRALSVPLAADRLADPSFRPWIFAFLAIALASLIVAMMVAIVKPEERGVPYAFWSQLILGVFMLWYATRPKAGIRHDEITFLLGLAFPIHLVCMYLFLEGFPRRIARSGVWKWIAPVMVATGAAVWIARNVFIVLRMLGPARTLGVIDAWYAQLMTLQSASLLADEVLLAMTIAGSFAVMRRNYKLLPDGSDRRRIQIIAAGQSVPLVPMLGIAISGAVTDAFGASAAVLNAVAFFSQLGNALTIVSPLTFGYAVVKHRLLGFRVFVRTGIQSILARNALRAAALLPILWLVYTAVTHSDRTIGQILFQGWAKLNLVLVIAAALTLQYRQQLSDALDRRFFRAAYDQETILRRLIESVKRADSMTEIAGMAAREIDSALHVTRAFVFFLNVRADGLYVSYSTQAELPPASPLSDDSRLMRELGRASAVRMADELQEYATPGEAAWLEELQVELVAPLTGIAHDVVGLLMIGAKRSEEPFTSKDKGLLQLVAAQIGSAYEVLALRERVEQQQNIQTEVLASFDERSINLMKECPTCGRCYDRADAACADDGDVLTLTLPVERTIDGKYRLDRLVGKGGMGAVYVAQDLRLNRRVAVKIIKGSAFHSTSARRRFAREAQACARLDHPHLIRVYDYGAFENQSAYLVMEYVEGRSWKSELARLGAFTPAAATELLDQVFGAMETAHAAGILHRDLKPDNFIIFGGLRQQPLQVKILDFGLAKVREGAFEDPKSATVAGVAMGTFGYMSPEQLAAGDVDERTDVYALGVVALETLTGALPSFGMDFHSVIKAELRRRLREPAMSPEQQDLAQALRRALAYDRTRRFSSVRELRTALIPAIRHCSTLPLECRSGTPIGTSSTGVWEGDTPTVPGGEVETRS